MPRRVNLPGADELFRPTAKEGIAGVVPARPPREPLPTSPEGDAEQHHSEFTARRLHGASRLQAVGDAPASESGRVKHDEKMTVYVTADELLAVEQARLQLRAALGRTVDRGRFVRAAVALALADLDERGTDSAVARRLSDT
ncbi:MAG: hypothetical protein WBQ48_03330 [Aeromicrobium sp.]